MKHTGENLRSVFWVLRSGFAFPVLVLSSGFRVLGAAFAAFAFGPNPEPQTQNPEPGTRTSNTNAEPRTQNAELRVAAVCLAGAALVGSGLHAQSNPGRDASWAWKPSIPTVPANEVEIVPVRGKVYLLVGAGSNITVHAGDDEVLLVDTGLESMSEKVLAAIRKISTKPLRYIVNTTERETHTGASERLADAGSTIPFRVANDPRVSDGRLGKDRASVVSYLTVFHRMSAPTGQQAPRPEGAWPDNTYSTPQKKLFVNDEPVLVMHFPSTTDGTSIVHFRISDVVAVGDLVDLTGYPMIDVKAGGSIDAVVESLNRLIDITVPGRKSEGGTLVIPGHGRIADQPDVAYYREMVAIVRDRIRTMIGKGMTLEQVKAARPTLDWDARYGRNTGWTTEMFVEAAYASLKLAGSR